MLRGWPGPAAAQSRQGQVGGQLPAAVPDDPAILRHVMGQADRIPRHLARVSDAAPQPDGHPGPGEPGEELLLGPRPSRRDAHLAAQRHPRRLRPAPLGRLLRLGAGRPPRRGAIRRSSGGQPEPLLAVQAGLPHPVEVVPDLPARYRPIAGEDFAKVRCVQESRRPAGESRGAHQAGSPARRLQHLRPRRSMARQYRHPTSFRASAAGAV